jgi:hypothetical protein
VKKLRTFYYSVKGLHAAMKDGDELTRALAQLFARFGDQAVIDAAESLQARLWVPLEVEGRRGAPVKWGDGNKIYAWLEVEGAARRQRRNVQEVIARRHRWPWRVVHDATGAGKHLELTKHTAGKYHRDGAQVLARMDPASRAKWERLADMRAGKIKLSDVWK